MKLTKTRLKKIIKEELKTLQEEGSDETQVAQLLRAALESAYLNKRVIITGAMDVHPKQHGRDVEGVVQKVLIGSYEGSSIVMRLDEDPRGRVDVLIDVEYTKIQVLG